MLIHLVTNLEIKEYNHKESKVYSTNNLPKITGGTYGLNFDA